MHPNVVHAMTRIEKRRMCPFGYCAYSQTQKFLNLDIVASCVRTHVCGLALIIL